MTRAWDVATVFAILLTGVLYRYCHISGEVEASINEARLAQLLKIKWLNEQVAANEEHIRALTRTMKERRRKRSTAAIPASSDVFCQGQFRRGRTCRFKNLCMDVRRERFFILRSPSSHLFNVPLNVSVDFLDLTTVSDHNIFFWTFEETAGDLFLNNADRLHLRLLDISHPDGPRLHAWKAKQQQQHHLEPIHLTVVRGATHLTKRFFPLNIMHVFHDDWLGIFHLRSLWPSLVDDDKPTRTTLVTFDEYPGEQEYDEVYHWLANYYQLEDLLDTEGRGGVSQAGTTATAAAAQYICWEDAVVGNHKGLSWYQYGYGQPQGPIGAHRVSGLYLREAARFIFRRLGIESWDTSLIYRAIARTRRDIVSVVGGETTQDPCVAIFARRRNRLILNEEALGRAIQTAFGLPICWVRLEDDPLSELVDRLRRSVAAFGMHGSILILALFLPPGAVLVEGFPWGIPPANYTPYATLVRLSGMQLAYRTWTPTREESCVGHPTRKPAEGGIAHLPQTQQEAILQAATISPHPCCDNPHWLYRIFQDTIVDADAIIELIREGWDELDRGGIRRG